MYASVDHAYAYYKPKNLASSFKYKIAIGGLQTLIKHVLSLENTSLGFPMAEFTHLVVSTWLKKFSPSFKDALIPFGLSCIFPYHQIKVDEPLLRATAKFWILTRHVFQFNGVELCPTLEEFSAITGESEVSTLSSSWGFLLLWLKGGVCLAC